MHDEGNFRTNALTVFSVRSLTSRIIAFLAFDCCDSRKQPLASWHGAA
jgi:hypothetical protein